jgi:hypothetical protein
MRMLRGRKVGRNAIRVPTSAGDTSQVGTMRLTTVRINNDLKK